MENSATINNLRSTTGQSGCAINFAIEDFLTVLTCFVDVAFPIRFDWATVVQSQEI